MQKIHFCWYETQKWFLQAMAAVQPAENHDNAWGLIYLQWEILYSSNLDSLTKFSTSSRSTQDILPWIIFQMILTTITISTRITISRAMKRGIFKKSGCLVGLIGHVKLTFRLAQTHVFKKTWRMCLFYSILAHWCILFWLFCLFKNHFVLSHSFLTYFLYNLNK